ncbi:MAG: DUF6778 family protein [Pseudomonadota bacterium]
MPRFLRLCAIACMGASLAACATVETATRSAPLEVPGFQEIQPSFDVTEITVDVPRDLRVSEANSYYPIADIVWRGDPIGDRHAQITELMGAAFAEGTGALEGVQPVMVDVEVVRFHSLTEKARYTVGGVHSIRFDMTVRDAQTGAVLVPKRRVNADLDALGGRAAIESDRNGNGQKMRLSAHLAQVIKAELARPLTVATAL